MEKMTMTRLAELVPDEASAYEFLDKPRWKGVPMCPHFHDTAVTFIVPSNGTDRRRTRTGAMSARRLWQCNGCRKQFSVLTGTVMHGTKISIRVWVMVMFEFAANKNGIAAREVERRYGLSPRSAWHLLHRIREAMGNDALTMLGGEGHVIVADETFIGGSFKNMHKSKTDNEPVKIVPGEGARRPNPVGNKTAVLTLIDTDTGEARSGSSPTGPEPACGRPSQIRS